MLYEHEKLKSERKPLFTKDMKGIKRLIQAKLCTFITEDNCNVENGAGIIKDKVGEKDYRILYDSIVISEISDLQEEIGTYIAKGTLQADFKNEDGNVFPGITRRFSANIIIEENENHETEITNLIELVLLSA